VPLSHTRTKLVRRLSDRKGRGREAMVLVEGIRSVGELLTSSVDVRFGIVSPRLVGLDGGTALRSELDARGVELVDVADEELHELAGTESPQGVLVVCDEPPFSLPLGGDTALRLLVLDGVQDPGNVGTLIRSARAFGLNRVVLLDGSADAWSPKAVRASAGVCFRIPVGRMPWSTLRSSLREAGAELFVGAASGEDVGRAHLPARWALVVGNEGRGVRPEVESAGTALSIPMPGGAESLNAGVAGAILLYVMTVGKERP
jgi:RNA methyltransferase, TrmH family